MPPVVVVVNQTTLWHASPSWPGDGTATQLPLNTVAQGIWKLGLWCFYQHFLPVEQIGFFLLEPALISQLDTVLLYTVGVSWVAVDMVLYSVGDSGWWWWQPQANDTCIYSHRLTSICDFCVFVRASWTNGASRAPWAWWTERWQRKSRMAGDSRCSRAQGRSRIPRHACKLSICRSCFWKRSRNNMCVYTYVLHSQILSASVLPLLPVISHLYWHHIRQVLDSFYNLVL